MEYELTQTPAQSRERLDLDNARQEEHPSNKNSTVQNNTATEAPLSSSNDKDDGFLSGFKLASVVGGATLVVFLILLDVSIISTVSLKEVLQQGHVDLPPFCRLINYSFIL